MGPIATREFHASEWALGWPTGPEFDDAKPAKTLAEVLSHYSNEYRKRFEERLAKARAARLKREGRS